MTPRVDSDPVVNTGSRPISAKSKLPLNYGLAGTYRFGELGVCFVQDTIPDDDTSFGSSHVLRSYQMQSPLLSEAKIKKDYIEVPLTSLLPLNYEKLFVQPQIGEDIVASDIGLNVPNLTGKFRTVCGLLSPFTKLSDYTGSGFASGFLDLISLERIYSTGSLLSALGLPLHPLWPYFDRIFDLICRSFLTELITFTEDNENVGLQVVIGKDEDDKNIHKEVRPDNFRDFLVWSRDHYWELDDDEYAEGGEYEDSATYYETMFTNLGGAVDDILNENPEFVTSPSNTSKDLSLARPFAYQMACAEFFTNSHVNDVYTAELWRQNYSAFLHDVDTGLGLTIDTFKWNGVDYQYDAFSAYYVVKALTNPSSREFFEWTRLVFGYNRSLRYQDYFTGSRTRPLAVGDVNVEVNGGYVNIVDTIEKRWYAKFLNQVNRTQRKLSDYARALFPSLTMQRDFHNPLWLAGTSDPIDSPEVQNTGAAQVSSEVQNSTTSVLRSSGGRYAFEYHSQYYGVIIGLEWFDIKRFFVGSIEHPNFYVDRNDYFNPFLQFIGDQPIYLDELYASLSHSEFFGYTGRNNELKYRVDQAFGGFVNNLPGWLFLSDNKVYSNRFRIDVRQSSDFIRSWQTELDPFFPSLTGYSLGTYFHFIVVNTNKADNTRPMVANPQLD